MNRRLFLKATTAGLVAVPTARLAVASAATEQRLVVVILRGGLDALHALPPYEDKTYRRLRPNLALTTADKAPPISLDGYFGLHRALAPLESLYRSGELLFVPAASTQYRDRSHFDGQNFLENGTGVPFGADTGWLNRALVALGADDRRLGLSIGTVTPLILRGDAGVQAWGDSKLPQADDDFLRRVGRVYADDPLFSAAFEAANEAPQPDMDMAGGNGRGRRGEDAVLSARAAADLLSRDDGPRVAVLDLDGWDTHFNQEPRLAQLFEPLANAIVALKRGLAEHWPRTQVLVVSEFGRTAAENGNRGTDHGTGGLAMIAGGAVNGGRIVGDWPGLSKSALWERRDLRTVNAYESIFKTALVGHLGIDQGFVEDVVFPNSADLRPMTELT